MKEDINGTEAGRWIALTQQPNEALGGKAGRSACDETGGCACVCTDSSVLPPRCELKGVGAQTCHVVLLTPCSHSVFFFIYITPCTFIIAPIPVCFLISFHCSQFARNSSLLCILHSLLQTILSSDLQANVSDGEESAAGPQEDLDKEMHAQRETALRLAEVSLHKTEGGFPPKSIITSLICQSPNWS